MYTSLQIKKLLEENRLAPSKKRGQNFLVQPRVAEKIVAAANLSPEDTVVELGVGLGALTLPLAASVRQLYGIELDKGLIRYHQENKSLPDNVILIHQDMLKADFFKLSEELNQRIAIVSNLPYSISNPFIFRLLEQAPAVCRAVLMLQKEVAERLCAGPGSREYGVLSVLLSACARVEKLFAVGPCSFYPQPTVDSLVIGISFANTPDELQANNTQDNSTPEQPEKREISEKNRRSTEGKLLTDNQFPERFARLKRVCNAAFSQRRKTLLNSLSAGLCELSRDNISRVLNELDIPPKARAEQLDTQQYILLSERLR